MLGRWAEPSSLAVKEAEIIGQPRRLVGVLLSPPAHHLGEPRDDVEDAACLRVDFGAVPHNANGSTHSLAVFFRVVERRELVHEDDQACGEYEVSGPRLAELRGIEDGRLGNCL